MLNSHIQSKLFELGRLDVIDLYEWFTSDKLNYTAYFQRQYVWREKDREELIDTIMSGYPIPAIFLCEASTDLTTIKKTYNVLDGRQRLESIFSFINNEFSYKGKKFGEMSQEEKSIITNYSIAIVQMYINPNEVDKIKEIFKRLNKNSYKLNKIEIKSSQLVEYDFMIICKIISGIIEFENIQDYIDEVKALYYDEDENLTNPEEEISLDDTDGNIQLSDNIKNICQKTNIDNIKYLITTEGIIFSKYQISRQVNLQHIINILGSILLDEIIHRNLSEKNIIQLSTLSEPKLTEAIIKLNKVNEIIKELYIDSKLDDFWRNTSCYYTMSILFYKNYEIVFGMKDTLLEKLSYFSQNKSEDFLEFNRYTQERGNDKAIRIKRDDILRRIIL